MYKATPPALIPSLLSSLNIGLKPGVHNKSPVIPEFNHVSDTAKILSCCSTTREVISSNLSSTFRLSHLYDQHLTLNF